MATIKCKCEKKPCGSEIRLCAGAGNDRAECWCHCNDGKEFLMYLDANELLIMIAAAQDALRNMATPKEGI